MPSFNALSLNTKRLLLRPLKAQDAAAIMAIRSDPIVMRYHSTPPWTSDHLAHELITRDINAMESGEYLRLGLERKQETGLIGSCTLFSFDEQNRRAEIGYELRHSAWGCGYMHEALLALLAHGFSKLELNRVEADIDPRNNASARTLERLGFQKEGNMRERWIVNGEKSDTGFYGLLHSDWKAGRA